MNKEIANRATVEVTYKPKVGMPGKNNYCRAAVFFVHLAETMKGCGSRAFTSTI